MKMLLLCVLFLAEAESIAPKTVYVCDSRNAKRYHLKSTCKGLSNCTYKTIKLTEQQAKKQGKSLCKYEY